MMTTHEPKDGLLLGGLKGGNLLAFLAAIGLLRTLVTEKPEQNWKLCWKENGADWSPVLSGKDTLEAEELISILHAALKVQSQVLNQPKLRKFKDTAKIECEQFREIALEAQDTSTFVDRTYSDFVAALGCESTPHPAGKSPSIQDTDLRTMSGAGHQHFLETMRDLAGKIAQDDLRFSLFDIWAYRDEKMGLRWDPLEDRRYALRWKEPSKDTIKTMHGATRLAIEALPLFPTMPVGRFLETTGFSPRKNGPIFFSWPIWNVPIDIDTIRSLLSLNELQEPGPNGGKLYRRGIVEVYRSERITQGKYYRNFTSADSVLRY